MRVSQIGSGTQDDPFTPDLPAGFTGVARLSEDGDGYDLVPDLDALSDEVRGMKERAAAATVTGDAAKVRDALTGKP